MAHRPLPFDPIAEARRHWQEHGWTDASEGMAVLTSIVRVHQILVGRVERELRPLGLTFARYEILMLLSFSRKGSMPLGKMSERLQVHPASVTNVVDRLEHQGLVRRVAHPTDGRAVLATLTPAGRRLAADVTKVLNDTVFSAIGLSLRDQHSLFALLRKVRLREADFLDVQLD